MKSVQLTEYQFHNYNNEDLLSAFQSITIYLLLQAQDLESKQQNDIASMLVTLMVHDDPNN